MPPAKSRLAQEDSRSDVSTIRERQIAAAAHARKSKNGANRNGSALKEPAFTGTQAGEAAATGQGTGMHWNTAPPELLETYRVAYNLSVPAAFASPLNQALLTNPGSIGRQSPTMARKKEKRRISKEQLALAVRKHFNGAAVNENDVVVEFAYKIKNQGKAFRMRSAPAVSKKQ